MLENEENKMNTENNGSEVKNESNIENVKNTTEEAAENKATEEMFEESDFVTPPQDGEPEQKAEAASESAAE